MHKQNFPYPPYFTPSGPTSDLLQSLSQPLEADLVDIWGSARYERKGNSVLLAVRHNWNITLNIANKIFAVIISLLYACWLISSVNQTRSRPIDCSWSGLRTMVAYHPLLYIKPLTLKSLSEFLNLKIGSKNQLLYKQKFQVNV